MTPSIPIAHAYWVLPKRFAAGAYPGHFNPETTRLRMDRFIENGFTHFFDLTSDYERPPYHPILMEEAALYEKTVHWRRFPIGDFGLPTPQEMQTLLKAIEAALQNGGKIYLHCWGGIGRTGTAVGCYLVQQGYPPQQALKQVNDWCFYAPSPETEAQRKFILNWQNHVSR